jgi:four helix bundle protein
MENRTINLLIAQNVYSMATQVALHIFELSRAFPHGGSESIRSKLIQASGNVCSRLSDAWQNRNTRNIHIEKLNQATEKATATLNLIQEALDYNFLDPRIAGLLNKNYQEILDKISDMIANIKT